MHIESEIWDTRYCGLGLRYGSLISDVKLLAENVGLKLAELAVIVHSADAVVAELRPVLPL